MGLILLFAEVGNDDNDREHNEDDLRYFPEGSDDKGYTAIGQKESENHQRQDKEQRIRSLHSWFFGIAGLPSS